MITVFYGNQVYERYWTHTDFQMAHIAGIVPEEVWQGCLIHQPDGNTWWRSDRTPWLESDVPAQLKAWVLLLT